MSDVKVVETCPKCGAILRYFGETDTPDPYFKCPNCTNEYHLDNERVAYRPLKWSRTYILNNGETVCLKA